MNKKLNQAQKDSLNDLLWDYMQSDRENHGRVRTGWGSKTKEGLLSCIERILVEGCYCGNAGIETCDFCSGIRQLV